MYGEYNIMSRFICIRLYFHHSSIREWRHLEYIFWLYAAHQHFYKLNQETFQSLDFVCQCDLNRSYVNLCRFSWNELTFCFIIFVVFFSGTGIRIKLKNYLVEISWKRRKTVFRIFVFTFLKKVLFILWK